MKPDQSPRPSLEWHLTDLCNYRCPYCCEGQHQKKRRHGHASDETVDAALSLLGRLPGSWQVKFSGAEETLHPRFMEVCRRLVAAGHTIALTTNFSPSRQKLSEFVETCGGGLEFINASLHPGQVDLEAFIDKSVYFKGIQNPQTEFTVCSVVTGENFELLQDTRQRLEKAGIGFAYQVLKTDAGFTEYPAEIEQEIQNRTVGGTEEIRGWQSYGTPCHTGQFFFIIKPDGKILRCFSSRPWYNYMGNIRRPSFRLYDGPRPCLSAQCTCVVPANRNMIRFGESSGPAAILRHKAECLLTRLPGAWYEFGAALGKSTRRSR